MSSSSSWENLLLVGGWYQILKIPETLVVARNCSFIFRRFKKIHGNNQLSWPYIVHQLYSPKQTKKCSVFDSNLMTPNNIYFCVAKNKTSNVKDAHLTGLSNIAILQKGSVLRTKSGYYGVNWFYNLGWKFRPPKPMFTTRMTVANSWYKISKNSIRQPCIWNCWVGDLEHPNVWFANLESCFSVLVPWNCYKRRFPLEISFTTSLERMKSV